jgi:hypothetical protein
MSPTVNRWFTVVLILGLVFTVSSRVYANSCSCSAADGSCSAKVSCLGGCYTWCDNDGGCRAACSDYLGFVDIGIVPPQSNSHHSPLTFNGGADLLFPATSFWNRFHERSAFDTFWRSLFVGVGDKAVANATFCGLSKQNL